MLPRGTKCKLGILFAALFFFPAAQLSAQVFDLEKDREPMVLLDGLWRFHPGDDARWADPAFDDTNWPLINSTRGWSGQGYEQMSGMGWYRAKVVVSDSTMPLALYIRQILSSYQVFADGKLIGESGTMPPHEAAFLNIPRVYALPPSGAGSNHVVVIAIRVWHWPVWARYESGGLYGGIRLGRAQLIQKYGAAQDLSKAWTRVGDIFVGLLEVLAGLTALALFAFRRRQTEFLWFGLFVLTDSATRALENYVQFHSIWIQLFDFLNAFPLTPAWQLTLAAFCVRLLNGKKDWLFWSAIGTAVFTSVFGVFEAATGYFISVQVLNLVVAPLFWPYAAWIVVLIVRRAIQGLPDARLILTPVLLLVVAQVISDALLVGGMTGWYSASEDWLVNTWQQPIHFSLQLAIQTLFLISVLAVLIRRFVRSIEHEEQLSDEFEAARIVQQVLIPDAIPAITGFKIESVYKPFGEVGGDFFQILPAGNGGVLVTIGDVSGKGMPAAMAVSLLVGTIRTLAHYTHSPGEILSAMNQRMLARSRGGFTTCLVLRIDSDGKITVANAGHIAPYINGRELPVENGLPLGLFEGSAYAECSAQLEDGAALTLMTDGVAEARARNGELFGFDRTANISVLSAEHIANTAMAFGQQDDITVLTISRAQWPEESLASSTLTALPSTG